MSKSDKSKSKIIESLTPEQEAKLAEYRDLGIKIGLATQTDPLDEKLVRDLTDKHRVLCKVPKATYFEVFRSPFEACEAIPGLNTGNAQYGSHDSYWLVTYGGYYREVLGLKKETEDIMFLYELSKLVGWMWMSSNTTIVSMRPTSISLEDRTQGTSSIKVLHNLTDLVLKYADGRGVYAMNGIRIPLKYESIMKTHPDEVTLAQLKDIDNTEIRNEFLKRSPYLIEKSSTVLDTATVAESDYKLLQADFGTGLRTFLTGSCPSSGKKFSEFVPPQITTVVQALAWREYDVEIEGIVGNAKILYNEPLNRT